MLSHLVIPILVVFGIFCGAILWRDPQFDRERLWGEMPGGRPLRRVLLRWALGAAAVTGLVAMTAPELLLSFPRSRPGIWAAIMVVYPLLSVYPQEIIFRAFLFHRYRSLLRSPAAQVAASTLAFGWGHVLFGNWTAPLLSTAGGLLFATTYARTGSLRLAAVEHALWGGFVFTVGLGRYFYSGGLG
jgi:membrane protease YdiL (CAAX protease family)